jgi:hypothetical protein
MLIHLAMHLPCDGFGSKYIKQRHLYKAEPTYVDDVKELRL